MTLLLGEVLRASEDVRPQTWTRLIIDNKTDCSIAQGTRRKWAPLLGEKDVIGFHRDIFGHLSARIFPN